MLGLKVDTDAAWTEAALRDLDRVLCDHAHCEMKAASNALSLATHPHGTPALVRALTDLAREEIDHFQRIHAILELRGIALGVPPVDEYAASLRRAASAEKRGNHAGGLVDRLLVGALIEARSCERFKLLAVALEGAGEREVSAFYTELLAAEARHYRTFVDLAVEVASGSCRSMPFVPATRQDVLDRLEALAAREADIVRGLARAAVSAERASIHG